MRLLSRFSYPLGPSIRQFLGGRTVSFTGGRRTIACLMLSLRSTRLLKCFSVAVGPLIMGTRPFDGATGEGLTEFDRVSGGRRACGLTTCLVTRLKGGFGSGMGKEVAKRRLLRTTVERARVLRCRINNVMTFIRTRGGRGLLTFCRGCNFGQFSAERAMLNSTRSRRLIRLLGLVWGGYSMVVCPLLVVEVGNLL